MAEELEKLSEFQTNTYRSDLYERALPLPTHSLRSFLEEEDSALPLQLKNGVGVAVPQHVLQSH
ncbi:MAG: hypothetical protein ABEJ80_03245 [Halarchaeum sp.]